VATTPVEARQPGAVPNQEAMTARWLTQRPRCGIELCNQLTSWQGVSPSHRLRASQDPFRRWSGFVSLRQKQGSRLSSTKAADSPLNRLRLQAGLTVPVLAERFGVTVATVSRWLSGDRAAPAAFIIALRQAAAGDPVNIAADQEAYAQGRKTGGPTFTFHSKLPANVSADEARRRCDAAIRGLAAGVQR